MANQQELDLDIYSDVVCPWCYIGQRRLEKAMTSLPNLSVRIRRRPYLLEPRVPPGGMRRSEFVAMHFGSMEAYAKRAKSMIAIAAAEGLSYRPDLIRWQPDTVNCHRLVYWAARDFEGDRSARMEWRLMELFHSEGADLRDIDVLVDAAVDCGLDASNTRDMLTSDLDVHVIKALARGGPARGISGVPTYVFDDQFELSGARSVEMLVAAMRRVIALREAADGDEAPRLD